MLIHSSNKPVRIIGKGLVAKELAFFLHQENISTASCIDFETLESDDLAHEYQYMIGIADNQKFRFQIVQWLSDKNLDLCSWKHNQSSVNTDRLGKGVICYPFSLILESTVEDHCFVGPYCHVGHNAKMCVGSVLLPYSRILGSSFLGRFCQIQSGACVLDKRKISPDFVTILAGSTVNKDINEPGNYGGFPARRISSHSFQ